MQKTSFLITALAGALIAACAQFQPPAGLESDADIDDEMRREGAAYGRSGKDLLLAYPMERPLSLSVSMTDVTSSGQVAKVRGRVRNQFSDPVEGLRYFVTIVEKTGDDVRPLDTWQREVDKHIAPGDSTIMALDIESMYFGRSGNTTFLVGAFPKQIGERAVPPPPGWVD